MESIYEDALAHELELCGIKVQRQLAVPVLYKGLPIRDAFHSTQAWSGIEFWARRLTGIIFLGLGAYFTWTLTY